MSRHPITAIIAVVLLVTQGLSFVYSQEKEPDNGPDLVKLLQDKYGVFSMLNREGQIYLVSIEDGVDISKAVDRIVEIPTIEQVAFHWELERMHVDGNEIKKLGRLPKLTGLDIRCCKFQDKDAAGIEALKHLKLLRLDGNPITDAALAHLKSIKTLELLYLYNTKITGTGFKHLESLPSLRNLYLGGTPVTNKSLDKLAKVDSLKVIVLDNTSISDDGIIRLTGLYRLVNLSVGETKVTPAGAEAFQKAHNVSRAEAQQKGLLPKDYPQLQGIGR